MSALILATQLPNYDFATKDPFKIALYCYPTALHLSPATSKHVGCGLPRFSVHCRQNSAQKSVIGRTLVSLAVAAGLFSPLPAFALPSVPSTPYTQSQGLELGLENGRIRACPSTNPSCISTTSRSASFAMPWRIPQDYSDDVLKKIESAILNTQRNPKIVMVQDTPNGLP
eukprot:Gb_17184 [translate_table: standard]